MKYSLLCPSWGHEKNHIEKPSYARSRFTTTVDHIFWLSTLCHLRWTRIWSAPGYFYHLYRQWFRSQLSHLYDTNPPRLPASSCFSGRQDNLHLIWQSSFLPSSHWITLRRRSQDVTTICFHSLMLPCEAHRQNRPQSLLAKKETYLLLVHKPVNKPDCMPFHSSQTY